MHPAEHPIGLSQGVSGVPSKPAVPDFQVSNIGLHRLDFSRLGPQQVTGPLDVQIQLGTGRLAERELGVEVGVLVEYEDAFRLEISYRCVFSRESPFDEDEDPEEYWSSVASAASTLVLFPYVRAEFTHVLNAAGIHGQQLPLVNPMSMFPAAQITIAEPPE